MPRKLLVSLIAFGLLALPAAASAAPTLNFTSTPAALQSTDPGTENYAFTAGDGGNPPVTVDCQYSGPISGVVAVPGCSTPSSLSFFTQGDGNYSVSVTATDGLANATTINDSFTIDTTAPAFSTQPSMPEHVPGSGYTNDTTPTFSNWATTDLTTTTYTCWIDSDVAVSCNPITGFTAPSALGEGGHTFHVQATDAANNSSSTSKAFTVDTTAPTFTFGAVSGHGPSSNYATPSGSPTMSINATETLDGSGASCDIGTSPCIAGGASSGAMSASGLSDGEYTLNVSGTDRAGNPGTGQQKFFVDHVAPNAPTIDTNPPSFTNDNTPDFTFTPSDPPLSSASGGYGSLTNRCDIGSGFSSCSSPASFGPFADGPRTFKVKTTDPAGNTGSQSTYSFTIDTVAPTVDTFDVTPHGHTVIDTRSRTPHFTFTGHDTNPTLTFQCAVDGGPYSACTNTPTTGVFDEPVLSPLQEGHHVLHVKATDQATNTSTTDFDFYVDITKPTPSPNIPDGTNLVLHQVKTVTCIDTPTDNVYVSGIYTCDPFVDGGPLPPGSSVPTHSSDFGYHTIDVTATDEAGNVQSTNNVGPHAHYVVNAGRYDDAVRTLSPTGYWRTNDAPGSLTMTDASGNHNDGTWTKGVARPRTGPEVDTTINNDAGATELSGANAYGYVLGISAGPTAYTMDIWVKPTSTTEQSIYGHGSGAGEIYIDANGKFAFAHPGVTVEASTVAIDTSGAWYHLMATWNRASAYSPGTATLYVQKLDAVMNVGTVRTFTGTSSDDASGAAALYVGNGEQAHAHSFKGTVDDVAYWTGTALSAHDFTDLSKSMVWVNKPIRADNVDWTPPTIDITSPLDGDTFQTTKAAGFTYAWSCADPDGPTSCDGYLNGVPANQGDPLPNQAGTWTFTVKANDGHGLVQKSVTFTLGTYSGVVQADSPFAYWRLGEPSAATTLVDSSGHGHNGEYKWDLSDPFATANGGAGISGDTDTTRQFFGSGAYAYVNGIDVSDVGLTEEVWAKVTDPARDQAIIEHGGAGLLAVRGGKYVFRPNTNAPVELVGSAPTGGFDQVVGTWDGITAKLYVNGVLKNSAEAATPPPSGSATFYLGHSDSTLGPFHGTLDEAAYWTHALSAHSVMLHFRADPPPPADAVVRAPSSTPPAGAPTSAKPKPKAAAKAGKVKAAARSLAKAKAKLKLLQRHHASKKRLAAQRHLVARLTRQLRALRRHA